MNTSQKFLFCTGELADSLAEVNLYPVAPALVEDFAHRSGARLELRTKSDKVESLLGLDHRQKTTVAFSIMPQLHVTKYESGTASLVARLRAARLCQDAGYPVALKFEPLILTPDWKQLYEDTLHLIALWLNVDTIHHVSVGCLRWSEQLAALQVFIKHYSSMLQSGTRIEYRPGMFNGTAAWPDRLEAYQWMRHLLRHHGIAARIWWSMEESDMIEALENYNE
jgi:hypothetical protein